MLVRRTLPLTDVDSQSVVRSKHFAITLNRNRRGTTVNRYRTWMIATLFSLCLGATQLSVAQPLDINRASAEQLAEAIDGVGLIKARAIIEDRDRNGPFESVDDLARVKGIGTKMIEGVRTHLTVE